MSKSSQNMVSSSKLENPQKLPLDKLYLKVFNRYGARDIKAIDPFWIPDCVYPKYYPLSKNLSKTEIHNWLFKSNSYLRVLKMFFNCSYQEFWCIVVYEPAFPIVLESFLEGAVAPYLPQPDNELIAPLYSDIYSLVFAIYNRLLAFRNSETEFMEPSTISVFLYDNSVIKIETIVQLIKLYGPQDDGPLINLIQTIFEVIPNLNEHLQICASNFYDVFESISAEAYEYDRASTESTNQLCLLLYDTTFCLRMLINVYEPFKKICIENGLISKFVHSYEEEIPLVSQLVQMVIIDDKSDAIKFLKNAKIEILELCHILLCHCFELLLQSQDTKYLSMFLDNVEAISKTKKFASSYDSIYPLHSQLETLKMIFPDYLYNNSRYETLMFIFGPQTEEDILINDPEIVESENEDDNLSSGDEQGASAVNKNLDDKIKEIIEILPYYCDGFIEHCLKYYDLDTERTIEAILNPEQLPPELSEIDTSLPRIPPEVDNTEKPVLEYKGKKPDKYKNFNELLNDKTELADQKERYLQYQNEEWYESLYNDDYESDVDDYTTPLYEGGDILDSLPKKKGTNDDETDENRAGPSRNKKYNNNRNKKSSWNRRNPNLNKQEVQNGESSGEDDPPSEISNQRPKDAFCEEPAIIRARREAAYRNKHRTGSSRDVVGNPKGQGQEKNVQNNRANKDKNKSSRANHNRRSGAQWKRSRGMVPSLFICSVYVPLCSEQAPGAIPACRNLCENVRDDCLPHLDRIGRAWPPELACERFPEPPNLCMDDPKEKNLKILQENLNKNISFNEHNLKLMTSVEIQNGSHENGASCPPRFVSVDDNCSPICNLDAFYKRDDKDFTKKWSITWALMSMLATKFTLITYFLDRKRFKYPERPILFMSVCCYLYSGIILLRYCLGSEVFICDSGHLVIKSSENMLCALSALVLQYLSLCIRMWWLIFCVCWYLHATNEWSNESLNELSSWFHGIVYSFSIIPPLTSLLTGHIVADELTESCTIREEAVLYFIFAPQFLCLLIGGLLSIRTSFSLCYIRSSLLASGRGAFKLERLMVRLCLFTITFVLVEFCYLVCTAYESWHRPWWKSLALLSALDCPTKDQCNPEPMYHTASIEVVLLKILFSFLVGISTIMWVCSGKTCRTWGQVLNTPKKLMPITKV